MPNNWSDNEIEACVRTYLWMRDSEQRGYKPIKSRIRKALMQGPLSERSDGSLEYRFQNISSVLADMGEEWIDGYKPAKNVGADGTAKITNYIEAYRKDRHARRVHWLIQSLPIAAVTKAVSELASGKTFEYSESTDYDLVYKGVALPPKKAIGYAGLLHYGAPLASENFSGGEGTPCFKRLEKAGFEIGKKIDPSTISLWQPEFRETVDKHKSTEFKVPPEGQRKPGKKSVTAIGYDRDSKVVAFVEDRAGGKCELCGNHAPFNRRNGTPYLEVHHIISLAEKGPDTVDNTAALCPNCHRECHYGSNALIHQKTLQTKLSNKSEPKIQNLQTEQKRATL
ncbi:MAG: HNH endonuclease [Halopseudomonas sp.]